MKELPCFRKEAGRGYPMKIMERIALGRTVYLVLAVVGLLVLGAVYTIFGTEADFAPSLETVSPGEAGAPSGALPPIEEPAYAYESDLLTFAGSCTAGSMLGSAVWGTFNGTLEEEGAAYFLENLADLLKNDDFTLAGLDVTLSDRELPPAEKEEREWYIAPSGAADVFPSGGIDALSMEFPRTRDYGGEGYADTAAALQSAGIEWGDSGKAIYRQLDSGVKIAVYCCQLRADQAENVKNWLAGAQEKADFVALYLSDDGQSYEPSEEKMALMRSFIDAGADLVAGSNGSMLQPAEEYNGGFIVPSLGSLIDGSSLYQEEHTVLLQAELRSRNGELTDVQFRFLPCRTSDAEQPWRPVPVTDEDESNRVLAFMRGERFKP